MSSLKRSAGPSRRDRTVKADLELPRIVVHSANRIRILLAPDDDELDPTRPPIDIQFKRPAPGVIFHRPRRRKGGAK